MNKNDGGPAYPHEKVTNRTGPVITKWKNYPGMSLRDWFAGMALQGMMSDSRFREELKAIGVAKYSYTIADDMLQEREK